MTTQNQPGTPVESGYIPVNGLKMYYEIHGSGRPLVLLHGNLSTIGTSFLDAADYRCRAAGTWAHRRY